MHISVYSKIIPLEGPVVLVYGGSALGETRMVKVLLLVDDEPDIRALTKVMLERAGYAVAVAKDGEKALEMLEENKPDLILLDVMMPGPNGWLICEKIKGNDELRGIPVVMFTVRTSEDSIERSFECGADAHINKPFDRHELLETLRAILSSAQS